jgi:hypothetical protein
MGSNINNKIEEQLDEIEEDKEYIPTMKEKGILDIKKFGKFMIRYNSKFRMRWDLVICLLAIYNCVSIPISVAFEPDATLGLNIWERTLDVSFALDLLLNFRTTFVNSKTGFEISDWKKVAINYFITGRFFIDLGASIPLDLFLNSESTSSNKKLKLLGLMKLIRLLRLGRIVRYLKFKQGFKLGIRLFQLLFFLLMLVHWVACIWYLIVKVDNSWIPPKD